MTYKVFVCHTNKVFVCVTYEHFVILTNKHKYGNPENFYFIKGRRPRCGFLGVANSCASTLMDSKMADHGTWELHLVCSGHGRDGPRERIF